MSVLTMQSGLWPFARCRNLPHSRAQDLPWSAPKARSHIVLSQSLISGELAKVCISL